MRSRRIQLGYVLLGILVAIVGLSFGGPLSDIGGTPGTGPADSTSTHTGSQTALATVTVSDQDGTELGEIQAMVADSPAERYTGLSDTASLEPDEGMVFVYPDEAERTYVMRDMAFPLDMIFVASNGTITTIHHAPVENDSDLTRYRGTARWVIEVNEGWTTTHNVSVGDEVVVELPAE